MNAPPSNQAILARRQRRRRNEKLIVAGVLVVFAAALAVAGRDLFFGVGGREQGAGSRERGAENTNAATVVPATTSNTPEPEPLIDDDGRTLWAAPTEGPPLDLSYLPPGPQIVLALRPAALADHPEGEKVLAALGPIGRRAVSRLEQQTGASLEAIEQLIIGWRATLDGNWDTTLVVTPAANAKLEALDSLLTSASRAEHRGKAFHVANGLAYYRPGGANGVVVVVAAPATIHEVLDLAGHAPPLRREMERLVEHTDASRHVTLVCAPNFLFSDGRGMFAGSMSRLRRPLFWFLGDGARSVALSVDWHENFFVELLAVPSLDVPPDRLAARLAARVDQLPARVEDYVLSLSPQPYGRRVVARFPEMVRRLAAYTRHGFERDHAVLRCYLPAVAGHNLVMGAELTLAELPGGVTQVGGPPAEAGSPGSPGAGAGETLSVRERLRRRTTLRFTRDTLETALAMLSADVGVPIEIRGRDLQLEGITKNQSFGIDVADRPAEEILVEILRLANPDKMATGPADPRQKLVYVIADAESGGGEAVYITTRARAAAVGGELPAVFAAEPP